MSPKKGIQFSTHCTDRIFKVLIRTKILRFSKIDFQNLVVHAFALLLTPCEFKRTDYVMSNGRLNVRRNRPFDHFLSKTAYFLYFANFQRSIPFKLISQFGLKRCQKKRKVLNYMIFKGFS